MSFFCNNWLKHCVCFAIRWLCQRFSLCYHSFFFINVIICFNITLKKQVFSTVSRFFLNKDLNIWEHSNCDSFVPNVQKHTFFPLKDKTLFMNSPEDSAKTQNSFILCMQPNIYVYIKICIYKENSSHMFFSTCLSFRFRIQFPTFFLVFFPICSQDLFNFVKSSNFIFLISIKNVRLFFLAVKNFEQTDEYFHLGTPIIHFLNFHF